MDREEFWRKIKDIKNRERELLNLKNNAVKEYIREYGFKEGDKVSIFQTENNVVGWIVKIKFLINNRFEITLNPIGRNGRRLDTKRYVIIDDLYYIEKLN